MTPLRTASSALLVALSACSPLRYPDDGRCGPIGQVAACACGDAAEGTRVCDSNGYFGACQCADAGTITTDAGEVPDAGPAYLRTCGASPEGYVRVAAGSFTMGAATGELGATSDEQPAHLVELTRAFWIGANEVTQAAWAELIPLPQTVFECPECPVESVSWHDALDLANALSRACGLPSCYPESRTDRVGAQLDLDCTGFRLPTEAEWEYAARAGSSSAFFSGDAIAPSGDCDARLDPIGWYTCNARQRTHAPGELTRNRWGLADVHGNVAEWVSDGHAPYSPDTARDPLGPALSSAADRVARGGDWSATYSECRAAARATSDGRASGRVGLRLVRTAQE